MFCPRGILARENSSLKLRVRTPSRVIREAELGVGSFDARGTRSLVLVLHDSAQTIRAPRTTFTETSFRPVLFRPHSSGGFFST